MNFRKIITLSVLLLSGCAGMSASERQEYADHINQIVPVGISYTKAIEQLVKEGFSCDDQFAAPATTCSRIEEVFISSCVTTVYLTTDKTRMTVVGVKLRGRMCTSL